MERKIDAVVKEEVETDLKDEDEEGCAVHDPDSLEEDFFSFYDESLQKVHDPDSLEEDYDESLEEEDYDKYFVDGHNPCIYPDEEFEKLTKGSNARNMFEDPHVIVLDLASRLKANSEVVNLSRKILKHIKDGNDDVELFSGMVNQVLENKSFCEELHRAVQVKRDWYGFMAFEYETHNNLSNVDLLSRIRRDNLFRFAGQEFFKVALEEGEFVRGALTILFPFCMTESYLQNKGFWDCLVLSYFSSINLL